MATDVRAPSAAPVAALQDAVAAAVVAALGFAPTSIDTLVQRTGMAAAEVKATLATLEIDRRVAALAGGLWQLLA